MANQNTDSANNKTLTGDVSFQVFILFISVVAVWLVQYVWKRRRLYELASKLPGPKCFPLIGNLNLLLGESGDVTRVGDALHKEFDAPFRIWLGPAELLIAVSDPEHIQTVLTSPKALCKSFIYDFLRPWMGDGLVTAKADVWRRHRKIISPTFNQKILNTFVDTFIDKSNILVEKLRKEVNKKPFDVFDYLTYCTLDVATETMLGVNLHIQKEEPPFKDRLESASEIASKRLLRPWLHNDLIFRLTGYEKKVNDESSYINDFSDSIIKNKRALLKEKGITFDPSENSLQKRMRLGFLDLLLNMSESESNLTDREIRDEVNTMITTGTDTTANVSRFVIIVLAILQDIQGKVYEEIFNVFGDSDRPIEIDDLFHLDYLERVLKETMRMFTHVPLIGRYLTGEIKVGDYLLPADCTIVLFCNAIHKDPKLWPDPEKFDPDRFLPEQVANRNPYSYLPFGGGPRVCVGMKYALMALKIMITSILREYRIHSDSKLQDIQLKYAFTWKPVTGHLIQLSPRKQKQ